MEAMTALKAEVRELRRSVDANHKSIGDIRGKQGTHDVEIAVMHREIDETREDIAQLNQRVAWMVRGAWALAATFLMFTIALASLIIQVAANG